MAGQLDTTEGWCCDGRTYYEHASKDGRCCQPQGTELEDLPDEAKQKAEQRLAEAG
jgi:hypothetical protein